MKKALQWIICLSAIALILFIRENKRECRETVYTLPQCKINCAIGLNHNIFSSQAKNVGFHYELLNQFGQKLPEGIHIVEPIEEPLCWEYLINDSIQLLVFDSKDTIPEKYASMILTSSPIKDSDIWAVSNERAELLNTINYWFTDLQGHDFFENMIQSYFRSYNIDYLLRHKGQIKSISPYDDLIKKYSRKIGLDWRLLSAIIYEESQFKIGASSDKNARGLMQVKEATARRYGNYNLYDPESNLNAGTRHLEYLIKKYDKEGLDSINVVKFALAAYHAGEKSVDRRRQIADSLGYDAKDWESVKLSTRRKTGPTTQYINNIFNTFEAYMTLVDK